MAIKKYYDSDCNLGVLGGKTVAVIGFGSQGHAHSENLAESGVNVVVGLRKGSAHWAKASEFAATHDNFKVMEVEEAAKAGDVVMMLVPDELCADIYNTQVAPYMTEGKALAFAHGFNIHFKTITAPKNVDVIMIAPKGTATSPPALFPLPPALLRCQRRHFLRCCITSATAGTIPLPMPALPLPALPPSPPEPLAANRARCSPPHLCRF